MALTLGLPVASGLSGCASEAGGQEEEPPTGATSEPIRGGTIDTDTTAAFAMVVRQGEDQVGLCTATLIERNLFLTARHCLVGTSRVVTCGSSQFEDPKAPLAIALVNATELDREAIQNAPIFHGVALFLPAGKDVCGNDIALVETEEQVPHNLAVPIEPRLREPAQMSELYTAVGYGGTSDAGTGSGIRRSRQDLRVLCTGTMCGAGVAASEFLGEIGTCQGDSGGPSLDADGRVIGVLSRGGDNCTLPIYGSVEAWGGLISTAARSAAERGGYPAPSWSQGTFPAVPSGSGGGTLSPSGGGGDVGAMADNGGCAWVPRRGAHGIAALPMLAAALGLGGITWRRRRARAQHHKGV